MPTLTGTLKDVTGVELLAPMIRRVFVKAPMHRPSLADGGGLIVSAPVDLDRSGVLSVELEPGPAVLVVDTFAGGPDTYELHVTADMTLLSEAVAESSPDRSWVESVMVQLRADAVAAAAAAAQDRAQTGLDRVATGEDREQTGLDRTAAERDRDEVRWVRDNQVFPARDAAVGSASNAAASESAAASSAGAAAGSASAAAGSAADADGHAGRAEAAANEFGLTATSSTLAPGAAATVTVSGDGPAYSLAFGVPQGEKGDKGDSGGITDASELTGALTDQVDATNAMVIANGEPSPLGSGFEALVNHSFVTVPQQLADKSDVGHTHPVSDVGGLQAALDEKAATSHTHSTAQVTGLDTALAGKAATSHTHTTSQVTGLDAALAGKASTSHTHTPASLGAVARSGTAVTLWSGTQSQYDALATATKNAAGFIAIIA